MNIKTPKKDWFKLKRYPHIGFPLNKDDRKKWIEEYVSNPKTIEDHKFLPFLHRSSKVRKFRKKYNEIDGCVLTERVNDGEIIKRYPEEKTRDLYLAGHLDSLIYSYYSEKLITMYEKKLENLELTEVITAYRKISKNHGSGNKCNIDFAVDVFSQIYNYQDSKFSVITFDIKGFFDNLDHKQLRDRWKMIVDQGEQLPDDHFNVFKSITRFSYVDILDIFTLFQNDIWIKTTEGGKEVKRKRRISNIQYLKKQNAISFCTWEDYLKNFKQLVRKVKKIKDKEGNLVTKNFGIPQGSPISAVLANIYLIDFDLTINTLIKSLGGIYRRYSDDMIVICPLGLKDEVIKTFTSEILKQSLEIQKKKTQIFLFERHGKVLKCSQQFKEKINENKNLIYLGLEFDGAIAKIKSSTISSFYRKMKRTIKRGKHYAELTNSKTHGQLFKRRILQRFSYKGAKRRRKYVWNKKKNFFEISYHFDWGNFLSYTNKAEKIPFENIISQQTKKSWNKLSKLMKY